MLVRILDVLGFASAGGDETERREEEEVDAGWVPAASGPS